MQVFETYLVNFQHRFMYFVVIFLVLADVPGKPRVNNISHESAVVSWEISIDHLESRITEYVVQLLNESGHIIRNVTIPSEYGKINGIRTVSLSNLLEFTTYSVRIAAVNAISKSNFTEKVMFFTFRKYYFQICTHIRFKIAILLTHVTEGEEYTRENIIGYYRVVDSTTLHLIALSTW